MTGACPECGGVTTVLADATEQCTSCGHILGTVDASEPQTEYVEGVPVRVPGTAKDPVASYIYAEGLARQQRFKSVFSAIGGGFILLGSIIMLLSPLISFIAAKAIAEAEGGHSIGWADVLNAMLVTGPGMIICFGTIIVLAISIYGIYMGVMMVQGTMPSKKEIFFTALAMGVVGSIISFLAIGGLVGFGGALMIAAGGLFAALPT